MSSDIIQLRKRILDNKPVGVDYTVSTTQYNFGQIEQNDPTTIQGLDNNAFGSNADLYTTVQTRIDFNLTEYPDGLLAGIGSKFTADAAITEGWTYGDNPEVSSDYRNVRYATYFFDSDESPGYDLFDDESSRHNQTRDALGTQNDFSNTSTNNRLTYKDFGTEIETDVAQKFGLENIANDQQFNIGDQTKPYPYNDSQIEGYYMDATTHPAPPFNISCIFDTNVSWPGEAGYSIYNPDWGEPIEGGGGVDIDPGGNHGLPCTPYSLATTEDSVNGVFQNATIENYHHPTIINKLYPHGDGETDDAGTVLVAPINDFNDAIQNKKDDRESHYIYMLRTGADEREKIWGFESRTDERDRHYTRMHMDKRVLYDLWKKQRGGNKIYRVYAGPGNTHKSSVYPTIGPAMFNINQDEWGVVNLYYSWVSLQINPGSYYNEYVPNWGAVQSYGFDDGTGTTESPDGTFDIKWVATRDKYGDTRGYEDEATSDNNLQPLLRGSALQATLTAPLYKPVDRIKPIDQGGLNANWVGQLKDNATLPYDDQDIRAGWHCIDSVDNETGLRFGLNPKYSIDFVGFPSKYYGDSSSSGRLIGSKYFDSTKILTDWRPISFVSSSMYRLDLQSYYRGDTDTRQLLRIKSGAPNEVSLQFRIASSTNNSTPQYVDVNNDENYNDFNYWFYVVNWDWKDGDPGGGACEQEGATIDCLEDIAQDFPTNGIELEEHQDIGNDRFIIHKIDPTDDDLSMYPQGDKATHTYIDPGLKIVKAIVFSTENNHWTNDDSCEIDGADNPDNTDLYEACQESMQYKNLIQAITWKLVTMRIYLGPDGSGIRADFDDIGGDDYNFLPWPEVVNVLDEIPYECTNDDININYFQPCVEAGVDPGEIINLEVHGQSPSGLPYRSSHPVISGLAEGSIYYNSIKKIERQNPYNQSEIGDKIIMKEAINMAPGGRLAEYGNYIGQSDLSQIRYFDGSTVGEGDETKPIDMTTLLDINLIDPDGYFHYYLDVGDDKYWDGITHSFPQESPVGDIFIGGYKQFDELCLFEITTDDQDGKTLRDTSGRGNKGILIGDYSVKKEEPEIKAVRDSYIKIPEIENKPGGF